MHSFLKASWLYFWSFDILSSLSSPYLFFVSLANVTCQKIHGSILYPKLIARSITTGSEQDAQLTGSQPRDSCCWWLFCKPWQMCLKLEAKRQMDYKPLWRTIPFKKSSEVFFGTGFSPLGPILICINFNHVQAGKTFLLEQIEEIDGWAHDFLSTTQNDHK